MTSPLQHMEQALLCFQKGAFAEAEGYCQQALALESRPDAWTLLGMVARCQGRAEAALQAYHTALSLDSRYADAYHNIANVLLERGEVSGALDHEQQALGCRLTLQGAWFNVAALLQQRATGSQVVATVARIFAQQGVPVPNTPSNAETAHGCFQTALEHLNRQERAAAERLCCQGLLLAPSAADGWVIAGVLAREQQDWFMAEWAFRLAGALNEEYADPWRHLALLLKFLNSPRPALAALARACRLQPKEEWLLQLSGWYQEQNELELALEASRSAAQIHGPSAAIFMRQGMVLLAMGRNLEAAELLRQSVESNPQAFDLRYLHGHALQQAERLAEAIAVYEALVRDDPTHELAWFNLGLLWHRRDQLEPAEAAYRQALQLNPESIPAGFNLSELYLAAAKVQESLELCRTMAARRPDLLNIQMQLAKIRLRVFDWEGLDTELAALLAKADALSGEEPALAPFPFLSFPMPISEAQQTRLAVRYCHGLVVPKEELPPRKASDNGRLRIGYATADFHNHATAHLMLGLFKRHDRSRFEIFVYSWGQDDGSLYRRRIVDESDHFADLVDRSTVDIARAIRLDGIDILVDLKGHTKHARPELFAMRPAPIQVTYLGYPGSFGGEFMDYAIVDPYVVPSTQRGIYTECLLDMPNCYQINDCDQPIAEPQPSRAACGLPEKGFVFCCFCAHSKIDRSVFTIWMRILRAVPGSVLWLMEPTHALGLRNLQHETARCGVEFSRLVFAPGLPKEHHLSRLRNADLFLDTFFYNAHTTASDALWAGVPVLTMPGHTFAARVGGSLNRAAGLENLVVPDQASYEAMAIALATRKRDKLLKIRQRLHKQRKKLPLFDTDGFTRNLEALYLQIWETERAVAATGSE